MSDHQRPEVQRSILPMPDRDYVGWVTYDAEDPDTTFPPIQLLRPPAGAPNVVVVLLDDVVFSASSAFGGPCRTPTAERLAAGGLKYNRFHTTALCSVVHWPDGIRARGGIRSQFTHVIGIAPTVLEVTGPPEPVRAHGVTQEPMHGTSMVYSFDDPHTPERHETQYFEMFCNRGIYHKGWPAVTRHGVPWDPIDRPLGDDVWELNDGHSDWTQAHNLADQYPEKLQEIQRLFLVQAARFNVLPMDTRRFQRFNSDIAGRPQLVTGDAQTLYPGMTRLSEHSVLEIRNKSHSVTAETQVPEGGADGVIISQGGDTGGWSLYQREGRLAYCYNLFGMQQYKVMVDRPVLPGQHQVRAEFSYDGGGLGKGGTVTLHLDGDPVGSGRADQTEAFIFSASETTDGGRDLRHTGHRLARVG